MIFQELQLQKINLKTFFQVTFPWSNISKFNFRICLYFNQTKLGHPPKLWFSLTCGEVEWYNLVERVENKHCVHLWWGGVTCRDCIAIMAIRGGCGGRALTTIWYQWSSSPGPLETQHTHDTQSPCLHNTLTCLQSPLLLCHLWSLYI